MPTNYPESYLPVLIHGALVLLLGGVMLALSSLIGRRAPSRLKAMPYESGVVPVGDTRQPFSVKFYLVAMLFLIFDIEVVFLYPWAILFRELGLFGLVEMGIFLCILIVGFVYAWKKGALEWA